MTPATINLLNGINRRFYQRHAPDFSRTRQAPWPGWDKLLDHLDQLSFARGELNILDLGCGNGRFARFLKTNFNHPFTYTGLDSSFDLLKIADQSLTDNSFNWVQGDLVDQPLSQIITQADFDLVCLFGLMHHIPSLDARKQLLFEIKNLLRPSGLIAVSFWQFLTSDRFKKRIIPWAEYQKHSKEFINPSDLEANDFILRWGRAGQTFRYCHFSTDQEINTLIDQTGLTIVDDYHADGLTGRLNRYLILSKPDISL